MISRRGFLRGLLAAPAVVAFANLMPVRGIIMPVVPQPLIVPEPDISFQITGMARISLEAIRSELLPPLFDVVLYNKQMDEQLQSLLKRINSK